MSHVFYVMPFLDDEGNLFAESDATVDFTVTLKSSEPVVEVDSIDVKTFNNKVLNLSAFTVDPTMLTLFLRAKDALESDGRFIGDALAADDSVGFHGLGANDPDSYYYRVAS